jgi:hypothetical protein
VGWLELGVYVAGFIVAARLFYATSEVDDDLAENRLAAIGVGVFWPVLLALVIVWGILNLPTLGVKTRRDRAIEAETERWEQDKRATRIAELEAENELLRQQRPGD